jgi:RNA polymerase sigma factor (sigma-70 family)
MPATAALAAPRPFPEPDRPIVGRPAAAIVDHEAPLIRRAQAGDRDAVGELYSRHRARVRRYLITRLPDRDADADADDLVAETFLTAMQRIAAFEPDRPGEFGNWLVGIARNKLLVWSRRPARRELAVAAPCPPAGAETLSPEEVALNRLEVADALSSLAPRMRRALVLQHVAGLPTAEIALALGTTKRGVWALTGQARSALRGEVRQCACGCGRALRPERWGRDRFATVACARRAAAAAPVLCACGCGAELPAVRAHNRRYATMRCRNRAAWRRRKEAQRRYLAAPVTADPAVERVLAVVRAAGGAGTTRGELARRTRLLAARLDRALDLLSGRWSVSVVLEPSDGRLVLRYRALGGVAAGRAA